MNDEAVKLQMSAWHDERTKRWNGKNVTSLVKFLVA
jgi:hypothetical protein